MMERSLAIKCPSIHYHLAGCKKVQQELARPGVVERYISTPEDSAAIKGIFTGLYSLDKVMDSLPNCIPLTKFNLYITTN